MSVSKTLLEGMPEAMQKEMLQELKDKFEKRKKDEVDPDVIKVTKKIVSDLMGH